MTTKGRRKTGWIAGVCVAAAAALAGCGADGSSSAVIPATQKPSIVGAVYAPNGEFAALARQWQWAYELSLVARADALQGMAAVTTVQDVSLSRLDPAGAAHGCPPQIACLQLIATTRTDSSGNYQIFDDALADLDTDRLLVHVGGDSVAPATLTRAFVFSRSTDINAISEALVRLVLRRLTEAPTVPLNAFTAEALESLAMRAQILTQDLSGDSVADVNDKVYNRLTSSGTMQKAIDDVTGAPAMP